MPIRPLLATAARALLLVVAAFLLWGSLVALAREIPSSPDAAMRRVWNQVARGDTARLPPRQLLDSYRRQLETDYLLLPACDGLLLGLLAAAAGWPRRRDLLAGSLLFGAVMVGITGVRSPYGWGAAALFGAALLAAGSLRRRRRPARQPADLPSG
jgi:hypothetical protein